MNSPVTSYCSTGYKSESENESEDLMTYSESELSEFHDEASDSSVPSVSDVSSLSSDTDDFNDSSSESLLSKSQTIDLCTKAYSRRFNLSCEASRYLKQLVSVVCPEITPTQSASTQEDF